MTLQELRKKYIGKTLNVDDLDDDISMYTDENGKHIHIRTGDEYVYEAYADLDEGNKIIRISRMTCRRLVGDEATHVNYEPCRVNADDYDMLDMCLEFSIVGDSDEDIL